MAITTLNNRSINRSDTASADQVWTATSATASDFQAGGAILQMKTVQTGDYISTSSTGTGTSAYDVSALGTTFTPTASTSHILITGMLHIEHQSAYCGRAWITYNHSGISETVIESSKTGATAGANSTIRFDGLGGANVNDNSGPKAINIHFAPATTNEITFKLRMHTANYTYSNPTWINGTQNQQTNIDDGGYTISSLTFWEIAAGISPSVTNDLVST
jgi:hypothetical protein